MNEMSPISISWAALQNKDESEIQDVLNSQGNIDETISHLSQELFQESPPEVSRQLASSVILVLGNCNVEDRGLQRLLSALNQTKVFDKSDVELPDEGHSKRNIHLACLCLEAAERGHSKLAFNLINQIDADDQYFWTSPQATEFLNAILKLDDPDSFFSVFDLFITRNTPLNFVEDGCTFLDMALRKNCTLIATALVLGGMSVNTVADDGQMPLHIALKKDNFEMTNLLLHQGAEFIQDAEGRTPLHLACSAASRNPDFQNIALHLARQVSTEDIDVKDAEGRTALHLACFCRLDSVAQKLIDRGADKNAVSNKNESVFYCACRGGLEGIALQIILERGFDDSSTTYGETALLAAARNGLESIITYALEKNARLDATDWMGNTVLHFICMHQFSDIALEMIGRGADGNARNTNGDTPFLIACQNRLLPVVHMLLEKNADVNVRNIHGVTPLLAIADHNFDDEAEALVHAGANLGVRNNSSFSPLHLACNGLLIKSALAMIEADADIEAKTHDGSNPLMFACFRGSREIARALLVKGARVDEITYKGNSALDYALYAGHLSVSEDLVDYGADLLHDRNIVRYFPYLKPKLCTLFTEFYAIYPRLLECETYEEFLSEIESHVSDVLDPDKNDKDSNPLKVAFLLRNHDLLREIKQRLSPAAYAIHLEQLKARYTNNQIEDFLFVMDTAHCQRAAENYEKNKLEIEEQELATFDLFELEKLFAQINFRDTSLPGYKDPSKLRLGSEQSSPENYAQYLHVFLTRIHEKSAVLGAPRGDRRESLEKHYSDFERFTRHIVKDIHSMPPGERADILIDLARMGAYCGGQKGDAFLMDSLMDMIQLSKGQLPTSLNDSIDNELRPLRLGILQNWSRFENNELYEVHEFNQLMYLLGNTLGIPNADAFNEPDDVFSHITFSPQQALKMFSQYYSPSLLIDVSLATVWSIYNRDSAGKEMVEEWFKDNPPDDWKIEFFAPLIDLLEMYDRRAITREELIHELKAANVPLSGDPSPYDAIEQHRIDDFMLKHPHAHPQQAEGWNEEFYSIVKERIEEMQSQQLSRDDIREYLSTVGITLKDENLTLAVQKMKGADYLIEGALEVDEEDYKVTGLKREAIAHMLLHMNVLKNR